MFNIFNSVISFFSDIVSWVLALFSHCLSWLLGLLSSSINSLLDSLVDSIPDLSSFWGEGSVLSSYLGLLDCWIAVDVGFSLILVYFSFIVIMITVKLVVKLFIPFVG